MLAKLFKLTLLVVLALWSAPSKAGDSVAPADAKAFFVNLKDGDTVASPVTVKFGVTGLTLAPAGTDTPGTGHFHLLIDTSLSPEEMKFAIPNDAQHLHFGKAQTEATITLTPGKHTLQIVMGDGKHELHNPPVMSRPITITVQ
jgi:hypothetical protein